MELKIYWTNFSKQELKTIFDYYKEKAGLSIAKNLALGITKEVNKLKNQPTIGQEEELLENDSRDFRYLLYNSHYKIINWVHSEKNRVEIFDVFDTRQNPINIKRNK